mgnify:CR=1 FL=1
MQLKALIEIKQQERERIADDIKRAIQIAEELMIEIASAQDRADD